MKLNITNLNSLSPILILSLLFSSQILIAQSVLVNGTVRAPDGALISNVEIAPDIFTDDLGYYEFTVESEFLMQPHKVIDDSVLDCFSQNDLEQFQLFTFGSNIPDFYDQLVMDINNSNQGTTIDFVILTQAIEASMLSPQFQWYLFTQESFDNNPDANSGGALVSSYLVNDFNQQEITVNWIAFLEGNVDGDYSCTPVSVEPAILETAVSLFPNPVHSYLNIDLPNAIEAEITVFNILGKQVKQSQIISNSSEINFSNLVNGIYFLEVNIGRQQRTFKVVKE